MAEGLSASGSPDPASPGRCRNEMSGIGEHRHRIQVWLDEAHISISTKQTADLIALCLVEEDQVRPMISLSHPVIIQQIKYQGWY